MDKRLGKRGKDGNVIQNPNETVSGRRLPPKPYSTLEIGNGYFVVPDTFPAAGLSEAVAELKRQIEPSVPPPSATPRATSKAVKKGSSDET